MRRTPMKPVIFLDFDGVLNSTRSQVAFRGVNRKTFDPVAVNLVARLAGETGANVVISSAWRIGSSVLELRSILSEYSTTLAGRVIGMTPMHGECRGAEIAMWLAENPSEHNGIFAIIDDDADMLDGQLSRFVQCRHRDGFGIPEYLAALEILKPDHEQLTQLSWYRQTRPLSSEARRERLDWSEAP